MSTNTPNYNLIKPVDADNADLKIFVGNNMDIIDSELKKRMQLDPTYGTNQNATNSAFRATADGTQAMTSGSVTKINFTTVEYDIQGEYTTGNSTFTPKTAGVYMISACLRFGNSSAANNQLFISVHKNGAEYTRLQNFVNGTPALSTAFQAHGCAVVKCNALDTIDIYGYITTSGTYVQNSVGASFFSAVKIG